jgi:outer membrane lipopolysaccharide assembly protein LptE/RlpB
VGFQVQKIYLSEIYKKLGNDTSKEIKWPYFEIPRKVSKQIVMTIWQLKRKEIR